MLPAAEVNSNAIGWVDAQLSAELLDIADRGESEAIEFKRKVPDQATTLAKEIAGFATSGSGRIFLGIEDDGTIVGVEGCQTHEGRLALRSRIEGIVKTVQPTVQPRLLFATSEATIVAVIEVPKGRQPIYYSRDIPYLRQMTATRPMTPDEVIAHIRSWDGARRPTAESRYLSDLAKFLIDVDVMLTDKRVRKLKPWAEHLRYEAGFLADQARAVAASAPASLADTEPLLDSMSDALDTLARERATLKGSSVEIFAAMDDIERLIAHIRARWVPPETFGDDTIQTVHDTIRAASKQLAGLARRVSEKEGRPKCDDAQEEAAQRGMELLRCASLGVSLGNEERMGDLKSIALRLRELETRQLYHDGGRSLKAIIDDIVELDGELQKYVAGMGEAYERVA